LCFPTLTLPFIRGGNQKTSLFLSPTGRHAKGKEERGRG
jgi:hypothetical protein